ncbi:hypothetical protein H8356DRAFT_1336439 [Neocallimastix lanati (nom. inval.)]|nr:hypothetical protein H8356DRAFT_1336439 [Neocallimastix sp. JGI-2020a]
MNRRINKIKKLFDFKPFGIESVDAVPVWQLIIHPYYYMGKTKVFRNVVFRKVAFPEVTF